MEQCLHSYFIANGDVKSTCDFIPTHFEAEGYVYEVFRVIGGFPVFLDEHLERLSTSCELAGIKLPVKIDTIRQQISVDKHQQDFGWKYKTDGFVKTNRFTFLSCFVVYPGLLSCLSFV